jgi:glycosyltransferase involved in cell wall biosynthesis
MNVEFIIGTYNRPHHLATMLGSIVTQTVPNWRVHVIADGWFEGLEKVKEYFSFDNRIRFSIIDGPNKDFGNTPRMYGKEVCSEDWMIMTGDDNYYLPIVVEEILSVADSNTNFVYWDTLLNFANLEWKYRGVLYTKPEPEMIDVGSFATRPSLARQIKYDTTTHTGDGEFARDYVNMFCLEPNSYKKIDKILYLHN